MLRALRDADRDRHVTGGLELVVAQALGQPRGETERIAGVARRHDHAELLAADAADDIRASHGLARETGELHEQLVTGAVAVDVVDALEVVEVEHQHRHRVVRARGARQLRAEAVVEEAVVVEPGQRVGLREMLEPRTDLRVVERQRGRVAEPLGELELVLGEGCVCPEPVDVERALERAARDQRHDDHRLGLVRRAGDDGDARVEMGLVRPHRRPLRDRPAGQPLIELGPVVHDLFLVLGRAGEDRHELTARLVGLVDVERLVRHQIRERHRDAIEQGVEALLRHHLMKDLGQPTVRLDERLGVSAAVRRTFRRGAGSVPQQFSGPYSGSSARSRSPLRDRAAAVLRVRRRLHLPRTGELRPAAR